MRSYADSGEAVLFPWRMTPSEVLDSVFVHNRHGYLIGSDDRRRPQDTLRDMPPSARILSRIERPATA